MLWRCGGGDTTQPGFTWPPLCTLCLLSGDPGNLLPCVLSVYYIELLTSSHQLEFTKAKTEPFGPGAPSIENTVRSDC